MTYEFDAEQYGKVSSHQRQWGLRLVRELDLRGDEQILDLGCGDGALTAELARRVPRGRVLGIDASDGMIEAARTHAIPNLAFECKDINTLDSDSAFDVIFSNATLHWIKDHETLLRRIYRALRASGVARFNFAGDGNCAHLFTVVREAITRPQYQACFQDFEWPWFMPTVSEYEGLLRRSDFRDFRVSGQNADHFFADSDAMIGWLDQPSLVPFLARVPQADKAAFRDLVIAQMIRQTRRPDGRCFETFRRIDVRARK